MDKERRSNIRFLKGYPDPGRMNNPDYLIALARKGAMHDEVLVPTTALAKDLDTSQQTVSRVLIRLEKDGYIKRNASYRGIAISMTEKSRRILEKQYHDLISIFETPKELKGTIKIGLGEGAWYIKKYAKKFNELLGYTPFFGTLNLEVDKVIFNRFLQQKTRRRIPEFKQEGRVYGAVDLFLAELRIGKKTEQCAILQIERTRHPEGIIEVIAEAHIREKYRLSENDKVTLA